MEEEVWRRRLPFSLGQRVVLRGRRIRGLVDGLVFVLDSSRPWCAVASRLMEASKMAS